MKNISISGVTLSGNMGGQAMLYTVIQQAKKIYKDVNISLLSIFPEDDRKIKSAYALNIIDSKPLKLVLLYTPLSILMTVPLMRTLLKPIVKQIGYFQAVLDADLHIDLSGIAFNSKRGLSLLAYNFSCVAPALFLGKPVLKASQSVGPFDDFLVRKVAIWTFNKCKYVVARGEQSAKYLEELNLKGYEAMPDITFDLEISDLVRQDAKKLIVDLGLHEGYVVVSPSNVVNRFCQTKSISLLSELSALIKNIRAKNKQVLILAHSDGKENSKNNDLSLCVQLKEEFANDPDVALCTDVSNSMLLRSMFADAEIAVVCRFHAAVAALTMNTPCVIVGWSHKYEEMSAPFSENVRIIKYENLNLTELVRCADELFANIRAERGDMTQTIKQLKDQAAKHMDYMNNEK